MKLTAYCQQCSRQHGIDTDPSRPDNQIVDWYVKHAGHVGVGVINHQVEPMRSERLLDRCRAMLRDFHRWRKSRPMMGLGEIVTQFGPVPKTQADLLGYLHNADVKISYAATASNTITLASLATSSTLVAGQEGSSVSNSSNLYLDYFLSGQITTGTSPTVSTYIETWVIAALDDTPTWPDVFDGTDSAETVTTRNQLFSYGAPVNTSIVTATSDVKYPFHGVSLASLFGGLCPRNFVPFVVHSTAVNLNSTSGNHFIKYTPVYITVA